MGDLFLAAHERLPMKLVVKVLNPALICDESLLQFRQEAYVLARLQHPNIVQLIDFNWTELGLPFLVIEYLPGSDLASALETQRALGFAHIMALLQQIASGLYAAHRRGVVHRDLKPKNIMIVPCEGRRDMVKIIDFGVSTASRLRQDDPTADGVDVAGTPEFMAPEQALGRSHDVGPASDQFSLAVIAYLMVAGRLPWVGPSAAEVLEQVIHRAPQPLEAPMACVQAVLLRGLAKDPGDRYPSTLALARALRQAMVKDGMLSDSRITRVPSPSEQPSPSDAPPAIAAPAPSAAVRDDAPSVATPASEPAHAAEPPERVDALSGAKARDDTLPTGTAGTGADADAPSSAAGLAAPPRHASATHADEALAPSADPDAADDDCGQPDADRRPPPTVRLRRYRREPVRRWVPLIIGAAVGAAVGLFGPLRLSAKSEAVWNRLHAGASHAAAAVIGEGRHMLDHLPGWHASR